MNLYAESSAVLAWLLGEDRGREVERELAAADLVLTSDLTLIECDRVLARAAALGERHAAEIDRRRAVVATTSEHWVVLPIDSEVVSRSRLAFPREPVRTLDAVHLSAVLLDSPPGDGGGPAVSGRARPRERRRTRLPRGAGHVIAMSP